MPKAQVSVRHHFVPQWYQRGFLPDGKGEFYVLDKAPLLEVMCPDGKKRRVTKPKEIRRTGTTELFQRDNLYALNLPFISSDFLERHLFGIIDDKGAIANKLLVRWPITIPMPKESAYPFDWGNPNDRLMEFLEFINAQKTRTPRGLDVIKNQLLQAGVEEEDNNIAMLRFNEKRNQLRTVWTEAHWEIFSIEPGSSAKFLLSDDPVTLYNMDCYPLSVDCRYPNDPNPFWRGTRVLFPLSSEKLLVLSHKEHVDDPNRRKAKKMRRNARMFDNTVFSYTWVDHEKMLSGDQVADINRILKSRAIRFVAAYSQDDLYPEKSNSNCKWSALDSLFQPKYSSSHTSSEVHFGYTNGRSRAFNAYGEEIEPETEDMRARLEALLQREGIMPASNDDQE